MSLQTDERCEKRICLVCDAKYDAPAATDIEAESNADADDALSSWGLCPSHHRLYSDGMVFIVEVQNGLEDAVRMLVGALSPDGLARTGRVLTLPSALISETINFPKDEIGACLFVPPGMFDLFSQMRPALQ